MGRSGSLLHRGGASRGTSVCMQMVWTEHQHGDGRERFTTEIGNGRTCALQSVSTRLSCKPDAVPRAVVVLLPVVNAVVAPAVNVWRVGNVVLRASWCRSHASGEEVSCRIGRARSCVSEKMLKRNQQSEQVVVVSVVIVVCIA